EPDERRRDPALPRPGRCDRPPPASLAHPLYGRESHLSPDGQPDRMGALEHAPLRAPALSRLHRARALVAAALRPPPLSVHPAAAMAHGLLGRPGVRLFYREVGQGPPVVLVHGGRGLPHEQLLPDCDRLAGGFHLVYYDQRGCGRSGDPEPSEALTWQDHVAD